MARTTEDWRFPRTLIVASLITAALYFAQDVLIPLTLAGLLTFLLTPLVARLEHLGNRRLKRTPSVLFVAGLLTIISPFCGVAVLVGNQLVELADKMPVYKQNVDKKLQAMNGRTGKVLRRAIESLEQPWVTPDDGGVAPAGRTWRKIQVRSPL